MVDPDIAKELQNWMSAYGGSPVDISLYDVLRRAHDEIVALRKLTDGDWIWQQITDTRNEALEEAARLCEGGYTTGSTASTLKAIATAIRKLKDKRE